MDFRFHNEVCLTVSKITVHGNLVIPAEANTVIIFSHGSGSRFSRRNQEVAKQLREKNFGTLLLDLLTEEENENFYNRFDIDLLTKRLAVATGWLKKLPAAKDCNTGYFGDSTGAAAALKAASIIPEIKAVVSRGGRPDLVIGDLPKVTAPTLLIIGSLDTESLQLNKSALMKLKCEKELEIVDAATYLFEEPGKMGIVSQLAFNWFKKYLNPVIPSKQLTNIGN